MMLHRGAYRASLFLSSTCPPQNKWRKRLAWITHLLPPNSEVIRERIFQPLVEILVGSFRTPGTARAVDVIRRRWTKTGDLDDNGLVPGFRKMSLARRLRIKASWRKSFQLCLVEVITVSDAPSTGDHGCNTVVAMRVRCNSRVCGNAKHNRVDSDLIRIALQNNRANVGHSGTSCARVSVLRKVILRRRQTFLGRSFKKASNQRHRLHWAFFHQPMSGASNHCFSNIGCYVTHDDGLQRAEGLLSADGKHRHRELLLLKDLIVLGILRERGKLCEPGSHPSWLCVGCCEEVSGGFVRFPRIGRKIVPNSVEVDAFTSLHEPLCIGPVKVEVPDAGILQNFAPGINSRNWSIHHYQPFNLVWIGSSIRICHHVSDIVCYHERPVIPKSCYDCTNVPGLGLFVVAASRLRRASDSSQVRNNYGMVFHQVSCERCPRIAVLRVSVKKDDNWASPRGANEDACAIGSDDDLAMK